MLMVVGERRNVIIKLNFAVHSNYHEKCQKLMAESEIVWHFKLKQVAERLYVISGNLIYCHQIWWMIIFIDVRDVL